MKPPAFTAVTVIRHTPIGTLTIAESMGKLSRIDFGQTCSAPLNDSESTPLLREACTQLDAYFCGRLRRFDLPIAFAGTAFREKVWKALCEIPYGEVCSYGEIAAAIGQPTACCAVGGAIHNNPLVIVIPCHRVIGADGSLTGFGGGLGIKAWLLEHEKRVNKT